MANAADWSAASELSPERRKVMKDERSSLGASATPACFLNTPFTSLYKTTHYHKQHLKVRLHRGV